jgi:hypothetical protein
MAARKKGTLARAQSTLLKALRDFQTAVSEMAGTSAQDTKAKRKKRAQKGKRKTKAARR